MLIRTFFALLLTASFAPAVFSQAALRQVITPEQVALYDAIQGPKLSLDGKRVAMLTAVKDEFRHQLVVLDIASGKAKVVASPKDGSVWNFHWANNNRLVLEMEVPVGNERFQKPRGTFAVDADGGKIESLWYADFHSATWSESDDIFIDKPFSLDNDNSGYDMFRMNTQTGKLPVFPFNRPGIPVRWVVDKDDVPRVVLTFEKNRYAVHYLDPKTQKWRQLVDFDPYDGSGFKPIGFSTDGTLYVAARNGDKQAVYRYDLAAAKLDAEPVFSLAGYDISGSFFAQKDGSVGFRYLTDAWGTHFSDARHRDAQARVDKMLPGRVNLLNVSRDPASPNYVVFSSADVDPGAYYLFNRDTGKLAPLGKRAPWIDPARMSPMDLVKYKARDGMEIPAWVTVPKGSGGKNLPLVVLVHDGPWQRAGSWNFDTTTQFLASRGYAVVTPEYRGTTGFGDKHFRAGWKQLGLAMQDDLADAARWAVEQGIADKQRICIMGRGYGGYATLMGLIRDPETFKCGVDLYGPTDLTQLFNWWSFGKRERELTFPKLVGDPDADKKQLEATSPINLASRLKRPVLMFHRDPGANSDVLRDAKFMKLVRESNAGVEWVDYDEEEADRDVRRKNKIDSWTRIEKFLEKNIGGR